MLTLGIAGHVDHGKTSLVRALTGIETDRLPEEQRRGISIELGFAWLDVADLGRVALIDMPGHERFVRRMIAGAVGVDALLLVIAADEGVMPQGREHLAIAQLLGVRHGAVVLTKTDLCDPDMLALARDDVALLTADTFLAHAPVWPVSVRDQDAVSALQTQIAEFCRSLERARQTELDVVGRPFRLAIDRSFSLKGRGTVVAGTAVAGQVEVDQVLEVLPQHTTFRVRGVERHGVAHQRVQAPGRVALNLAGATLDDVPIGAMLVTPGTVAVSDRLDVALTLLSHCKPLPNRRRAAIQLGTATVEGTIVLLDGEPLQPGQTKAAQLRLDSALPVAAGEGFVVRGSRVEPRFGQTLGGGRVLHPQPLRHKLRQAGVLEALAQLAEPHAEAQILGAVRLSQGRGLSEEETLRICTSPPSQMQKALKALTDRKLLQRLGSPPRWLQPQDVEALSQAIVAAVRQTHVAQPTRVGAEIADLHRLLAPWLEASAFAQVGALLVRQGLLVTHGTALASPGFVVKAVASAALVARVEALLLAQGLATETPAQCAVLLETDARAVLLALQAAQAAGRVVRVAEDYWIAHSVASTAREYVLAAFVDAPSFAMAEFKEVVGLTRKHLIPFAEFLDRERVTSRDAAGNRRIREPARAAFLASRAGAP